MKHGDGIYKHANRTMIEGSFYDNEPDETCTVTRSDGKAKKELFCSLLKQRIKVKTFVYGQ